MTPARNDDFVRGILVRTPAQRLVLRVAVFLGVAAVLLYLPQQYPAFRVEQFNDVIVYSLVVLSLAILTGFSGQISIGHSAFFGVGAYTTAILVADHGWPHLATLLASAGLCFLVGILTGIPALRIRGLYLALVTLAIATVFPQLVIRYTELTGGAQGKRVPRFRAPDWTGLADDQWRYYVLLVVVAVLFLLVRNIIRSRVGRGLVAIRDNEVAAEVVGVNLSFFKVMIFGVSAMLAGVGGSLYVINRPFVSANSFTILLSITFLAALVIGGAATISGPVFGALFVVFAPEYTSDVNAALSQVIYGGLLILLMLVMPQGFVGLVRRLYMTLRRRLVPQPPTVTEQKAPEPSAVP